MISQSCSEYWALTQFEIKNGGSPLNTFVFLGSLYNYKKYKNVLNEKSWQYFCIPLKYDNANLKKC